MDLETLVKLGEQPLLNVKKERISDEKYLSLITFPKELLAPTNTFNPNYYEEVKKQMEGEKIQPKLISSDSLNQQLEQHEIIFNEFIPTKRDVVEGFGAKFLEVEPGYYDGFGMYHFIINSGLKLRMKKDRRWFELNKNMPSEKEEIFIIYTSDENEPTKRHFKRVSKKTYEEKQAEINEFILSQEVADMIFSYKHFFNKVFIDNKNFNKKMLVGEASQDTPRKLLNYANTYLEALPLASKFYLFYNNIGELEMESQEKIKEQLKQIEQAATDLKTEIENIEITLLDLPINQQKNAKDLRTKLVSLSNIVKKAIEPNYWIDVFKNTFIENMITFNQRYLPTEHYEDDELEDFKKFATLVHLSYKEYWINRDIKIEKGEFNPTGKFYSPLITLDKEIDKSKNLTLSYLKRMYETFQAKKFDKRPEIQLIGYLFDNKFFSKEELSNKDEKQ